MKKVNLEKLGWRVTTIETHARLSKNSLKRNHGEALFAGSLPDPYPCLTSFLIQPRTTCIGDGTNHSGLGPTMKTIKIIPQTFPLADLNQPGPRLRITSQETPDWVKFTVKTNGTTVSVQICSHTLLSGDREKWPPHFHKGSRQGLWVACNANQEPFVSCLSSHDNHREMDTVREVGLEAVQQVDTHTRHSSRQTCQSEAKFVWFQQLCSLPSSCLSALQCSSQQDNSSLMA